MNKSVTKFIKTVKRGFGKRSPEILLGIGIASGITATVLAVKATPKALELLTEKRYEKYGDTLKEDDSYDDMPELKPVEVVKTTWKCYIPAAISYKKLLSCLHMITFRCEMRSDENRAEDGVDLRWRFAVDTGRENQNDWIRDCLEGPCSVLEMMVALAIRIEETIMDNPALGDRTGQWFWGMITTMGLGAMNDNNFDKKSAGNIVNTFLDRQYKSDGDGGLFRIRGVDVDLTKVDIWTQLCWYLDSIS